MSMLRHKERQTPGEITAIIKQEEKKGSKRIPPLSQGMISPLTESNGNKIKVSPSVSAGNSIKLQPLEEKVTADINNVAFVCTMLYLIQTR